ncbi:hypothetical protein O159_10770 [Leifsonia xyli subsp. cynodontis DSM 46306]|uniref:Uncharacterized protein n=1 Tax=Leifsonia xyli subsp. cynodontis DSM 46306 TaxID=1389489 RepID=U3P4D1_LEIXC|nr:hypothetical protein [Leifsonia xyli]AGW41180.1 hypothetical protein O159_10770 [Leifsonia xyli subsp. cynodontis DSM 46306]
MVVEGTLRWQVTEDCPPDLLIALALRDLIGLGGGGGSALPRVSPAVVPVLPGRLRASALTTRPLLEQQWLALFEAAADRQRHPPASLFQPPHFSALDRAIELQDLVIAHYGEAVRWAAERRTEYASTCLECPARRSADIVEVVHGREHDLRRQAGSFRLDLAVLPLAEKGAWIVGPNAVVVSASLRDDSTAFRDWFRTLVAALV